MKIRTHLLNGVGLSAGMILAWTLSGFIAPHGSMQVLAADNETPKDIIATQVRRQGFSCKNPQNATSDAADTKPDEVAWILTCEDAKYRVILIPDMAARITKLN